jgi:hypothetical protein
MIIFLLIHLVLSGLIAIYFYKVKKGGIEYWAALIIIALVPIGGLLFCGMLFMQPQTQNSDEKDHISSVPDQFVPTFELFEPLDVTEEINVAPLEESLLVADFSKRREIILNLLKHDVTSHSNFINLALYNDDTETAHYAASGILHNKRKLDTNLSILSSLYQNDPTDMTVAYAYADLLRQYLTTIHLDPADKLFYTYSNIHVIGSILSKCGHLRDNLIMRLIDLLLEVENFVRANELCDILERDYPDSEEKFLTLLKGYFIMKDKQRFELALKKFRDSDLYFSSETMHVIRLWLGSVNDLIVKNQYVSE